MSVLDPIYYREPGEASVPNGSATMNLNGADAGEVAAEVALFPFSIPRMLRRYTNPAEQSAASGSVVTNDSPGFLDGFSRQVGGIYKDTTDSAKGVASGIGGVVGSLLPWWLWAILGLGAVAWLLTVLAPYVRRP